VGLAYSVVNFGTHVIMIMSLSLCKIYTLPLLLELDTRRMNIHTLNMKSGDTSCSIKF
jgi:hypothetical protein